jgi:DNA-binding winged helix-turn-helix (wHTH) protein
MGSRYHCAKKMPMCCRLWFTQTVTTEELYQQVWGSTIVSEGVIKRSICDLRNLFEDHDKKMIVTVPKQGYRLTTLVEPYSTPSIKNSETLQIAPVSLPIENEQPWLMR